MKILEITTLLKGGSGLVTTNIAKGFKEKGHIVDVISSGKVEGLVDWLELKSDLINHDIGHYNMNFFKREHELFWFEVERLSKLINEKRYDIIHVQAGVPAFAAHVAIGMVELNIPIIATFHSWSPNRPEWMNVADTWAFNRCVAVCYDSKAYLNLGKMHGIKKDSYVIYPGLWLDASKYRNKKSELRLEIRKRYNLPKEAIIITQLGEVSERKGQIDLVLAMKEVVKNNENVFLLLVGNDTDYVEYTNLLKEQILKLDLTNNIVLTGWVQDPYEVLTAADLFVFPSYNEGLGLAILEAIALEIPTVFSCIEGTEDIKEILGNNNFGTFTPGNPNEIANIVINFFNSENENKLHKIKKATDIIFRTFNFNKTVEEYEELFLSVLNNKTRSF
ncbi:MAG: glycosyltransferase family 4 protein [Bacillaceae bacterium]|nr:glycosyltransferase family 4 protein [Bacillaceae bacterium]